MSTILIVGGYGAVGRKMAAMLGAHDHTIILAGRNLTKAEAAAQPLNARARQIDLAKPVTWPPALAGVDLVIAAIDQSDTAFLEQVSSLGIAYLDVTAGDAFFQKAEALALTSPALLSVGLAPGLSNLLAKATADTLDTVSRIEFGLLMGTGDEHGSAAIAWSTHNMFDPTAPRDDAIVDFGPDFGKRRAYFMDFADQHVLARAMPSVTTVTRVAYDSALLTSLLFWLGRRFAGNTAMEKLTARASHMPTFGSDKCVLSVTASGTRNGRPAAQHALYRGRREASVTAAVAALMAKEILAGRVPAGLHHSHQVMDAKAIFAALEASGHGSVQFTALPITS